MTDTPILPTVPILPIKRWHAPAIRETRGNQTMIGAVILAMLGRAPSNPPRLLGSAAIDAEGTVWTYVQLRGMTLEDARREPVPFYQIDKLVADMRRLADKLKLDDADRANMFFELRAWITEDLRAAPSVLE